MAIKSISHFASIEWISVVDRLPEAGQFVILVTNDLVMEAVGRPSLSVDIGEYRSDTDAFRLLTDDLFKGVALLWAELPDVPWHLVPSELLGNHRRKQDAEAPDAP